MNRAIAVFVLAGVTTVGASSAGELLLTTSGPIAGRPLVEDGVVYVGSGDGTVYAVKPDGATAWRFEAGAPIAADVVSAGDHLLVHADDGVYALDRTGTKRWFFATADSPHLLDGGPMGWGEGRFPDPWNWYRSAPLVIGDRLVVGTGDGVQALSVADGSPLWHTKAGTVHTTPVHHDGVVIVGSWNNRVHGLDVESGEVRWEVEGRLPTGRLAPWGGWTGFHLSPALHDGVVFLGSRGTYFYALDATTGVERWSTKQGVSWLGSPAVIADGTVWVGLSDGNALLGYDVGGGALKRFVPTEVAVFARPLVADGEVIFGTLAGTVYAVDPEGGEPRLLFESEASRRNHSRFIRESGGLRFDDLIDRADPHGSEWRATKTILESMDSILALAYDGGVVYATTGAGRLYAIELDRD